MHQKALQPQTPSTFSSVCARLKHASEQSNQDDEEREAFLSDLKALENSLRWQDGWTCGGILPRTKRCGLGPAYKQPIAACRTWVNSSADSRRTIPQEWLVFITALTTYEASINQAQLPTEVKVKAAEDSEKEKESEVPVAKPPLPAFSEQPIDNANSVFFRHVLSFYNYEAKAWPGHSDDCLVRNFQKLRHGFYYHDFDGKGGGYSDPARQEFIKIIDLLALFYPRGVFDLYNLFMPPQRELPVVNRLTCVAKLHEIYATLQHATHLYLAQQREELRTDFCSRMTSTYRFSQNLNQEFKEYVELTLLGLQPAKQRELEQKLQNPQGGRIATLQRDLRIALQERSDQEANLLRQLAELRDSINYFAHSQAVPFEIRKRRACLCSNVPHFKQQSNDFYLYLNGYDIHCLVPWGKQSEDLDLTGLIAELTDEKRRRNLQLSLAYLRGRLSEGGHEELPPDLEAFVIAHLSKRPQLSLTSAIEFCATLQPCSFAIPEEVQRDRAIIARAKTLAFAAGFFIAVGEGGVAGYGLYLFLIAFGVTPPVLWPLVIFCFLSGALCNFVLFRPDALQTFLAITRSKKVNGKFVKVLFIDKDGQPLPKWQARILMFVGGVTIGSGVSYGMLSLAALIALLANAKVGIILLSIIVTGPVGATVICVTALFFVVIFDFIKNKRWEEIANFWQNYIWDRKLYDEADSKVWYLANSFIMILKALLAIALAIVITVAAYILFHQKGINFFSRFMPHSASEILTTILVSMNAVCMFVFGLEKNGKSICPLTVKGFFIGMAAFIFVDLPGVCFITFEFFLRFLPSKLRICDAYPTYTTKAVGKIHGKIVGAGKSSRSKMPDRCSSSSKDVTENTIEPFITATITTIVVEQPNPFQKAHAMHISGAGSVLGVANKMNAGGQSLLFATSAKSPCVPSRLDPAAVGLAEWQFSYPANQGAADTLLAQTSKQAMPKISSAGGYVPAVCPIVCA